MHQRRNTQQFSRPVIERVPQNSASNSAFFDSQQCNSVQPSAVPTPDTGNGQTKNKPRKKRDLPHFTGLSGEGGIRTHVAGNTPLNGLASGGPW